MGKFKPGRASSSVVGELKPGSGTSWEASARGSKGKRRCGEHSQAGRASGYVGSREAASLGVRKTKGKKEIEDADKRDPPVLVVNGVKMTSIIFLSTPPTKQKTRMNPSLATKNEMG